MKTKPNSLKIPKETTKSTLSQEEPTTLSREKNSFLSKEINYFHEEKPKCSKKKNIHRTHHLVCHIAGRR